jgi:hypothetical protein
MVYLSVWLKIERRVIRERLEVEEDLDIDRGLVERLLPNVFGCALTRR